MPTKKDNRRGTGRGQGRKLTVEYNRSRGLRCTPFQPYSNDKQMRFIITKSDYYSFADEGAL